MARTYGVIRTITCATCKDTRNVMWWHPADDDAAERLGETNHKTLLNARCQCEEPQWSVPGSRPGTKATVQVRESQRAVVYELPDGGYMAPESNDPNSDLARTARESGGIRREFTSIRELEKFQMEQRERKRVEYQKMIDDGLFEGTALEPTYQQLESALYEHARNQVLEYTEESLKAGRDRIREKMAEAREKQFNAQKKRMELLEKYGMRVGKAQDGKTYERLRGKR